ncbi:MAG: metallopeptidase family protein [Microbacteriaceae bacterium]
MSPSVRPTRSRGSHRDRHGRGVRSSLAGPDLPRLRGRRETFEFTVASTAEYLRSLWPDDLAGVSFEISAMPGEAAAPEVRRWLVIPEHRRIILYRLPIERMSRLHRDDELHQRMMIEGCVFRAVAELLGRDPWELAPDRYRHL